MHRIESTAEPSEFVPGLRLPKSMTVDTFWRLLDLAPNDPLSTHLVRLFALHLGKLTDEDKLAIMKVFNDRLGISNAWAQCVHDPRWNCVSEMMREIESGITEKIPGIGIANRKDLEA